MRAHLHTLTCTQEQQQSSVVNASHAEATAHIAQLEIDLKDVQQQLATAGQKLQAEALDLRKKLQEVSAQQQEGEEERGQLRQQLEAAQLQQQQQRQGEQCTEGSNPAHAELQQRIARLACELQANLYPLEQAMCAGAHDHLFSFTDALLGSCSVGSAAAAAAAAAAVGTGPPVPEGAQLCGSGGVSGNSESRSVPAGSIGAGAVTTAGEQEKQELRECAAELQTQVLALEAQVADLKLKADAAGAGLEEDLKERALRVEVLEGEVRGASCVASDSCVEGEVQVVLPVASASFDRSLVVAVIFCFTNMFPNLCRECVVCVCN